MAKKLTPIQSHTEEPQESTESFKLTSAPAGDVVGLEPPDTVQPARKSKFSEAARRASMEFEVNDLVAAEPADMNVAFDKPRRDRFFKVHPGESSDHVCTIAGIEYENVTYLIPELPLAKLLSFPQLADRVKLFRCHIIGYRGARSFGLWPIKLNPAGVQNESTTAQLELVKRARSKWCTMVWSVSAKSYVVTELVEDTAPAWPDKTVWELLDEAVGEDRLIDSLDHRVLRELRGLPALPAGPESPGGE